MAYTDDLKVRNPQILGKSMVAEVGEEQNGHKLGSAPDGEKYGEKHDKEEE